MRCEVKVWHYISPDYWHHFSKSQATCGMWRVKSFNPPSSSDVNMAVAGERGASTSQGENVNTLLFQRIGVDMFCAQSSRLNFGERSSKFHVNTQ